MVQIPVNTTSLVYIPSSNPHSVKFNQKKVTADKNIKYVDFKDGIATYLLASGNYQIESTL